MEHPHTIEKLPGRYTENRAHWIEQSGSLILKALASPDACEAIGMELLLNHTRSHVAKDAYHSWSSTNNALLALLSGMQHSFVIQGNLKDKEHHPLDEKTVRAALDLVSMGYDPLQSSSVLGGADALDYALMLNATELVTQWAISIEDISTRTLEGLPWIHVAAACGMREMAKLLVSIGVDPNMRDKQGNTPLFHATNTGMVECLRALGGDPFLRNYQKIDALTYMRSKKQRLEGEYLRLMTCALGERKPPDDLETAIAQFEALVYDSSGADLLNEAKNLNLPPSIRFSDGKTLLGQAVDRFLPVLNNRVISRDRNKASGWVSACSKWQEALQHGTVEDLGGLWVIGECTGHEKWVQCAKAELKRRSIEAGPVRQQAAIRVANAMIIQESSNQRKSESLNHDQTERLLYNMVCFPNFLRPDLLAWGLDLLNRQTSSPSSDLADAIARQPDDWDGWRKPGIIKELVVATLGFSAEKVDQAERYAHVVGRCLRQGGVIGAVLEKIINDYAYSASAPLLAAQIEKATLDAATTKSERARKSSLRL